MEQKIIIIGNGAAGISAAEEIRANSKAHSITMITDEPTVVYYRPMLSEYISEPEVPKRFFLHSEDWYKERDIKLLTDTKVTKIDKENKVVLLSTGEQQTYDKLILATGSYNFIPPTEGPQKENVKSLRTLEDANEIKAAVQSPKKVVILGGGLLGLELGWQLIKLDCEVTVVEMMDRLLPRQLDLEASKIFEEKVALAGIKVIKGVKTKEISGETQATAVVLEDGTTLPCDLIFYSIGVRAQTQLASDTGLAVNRGILVNAQMQTNDPSIFAAGDCAEYEGINYAIWPEAIAQGKTAGKNAIEIKDSYETVVPFNVYHGMNMRLFSLGDVGGNPEKQYECISNSNGDNYEKYYFEKGVFVGGILIGDIKKSVKLKSALNDKLSMEAFKSTIL